MNTRIIPAQFQMIVFRMAQAGLSMLMLTLVLINSGLSSAIPNIPDGFNAVEWREIQQQIAASGYYFSPDEDGWVASNPVLGWQTRLGPHGVQFRPYDGRWEMGLALTGYGYAGGAFHSLQGYDNLVAEAEVVTLHWDENLSEWWVNSRNGLEQGFILQERPSVNGRFSEQDGPLVVTMAISSGLRPVVKSGDVLFQNNDGETVLRYKKLHVVDAAGQTIPARLELQNPPSPTGKSVFVMRILVEDADAVYPLTIDPFFVPAELTASDASSNDQFGWSVAVDGDTAVIGAPFVDNGAAADSGAAYVFTYSSSTGWSQQFKLTANTPTANSYFGMSVAISGGTVVVGAPGVSNVSSCSISSNGAVYVFVENTGFWSQQQELTGTLGFCFGWSVAMEEDTMVVGAPTGDDGGAKTGVAYVYVRSGTSWTLQQTLFDSASTTLDYFGQAVSISGESVLIGAPYVDDTNLDSGVAYVFIRSGTTWSQQQKLSSVISAQEMGWSVALDGNTAVVGEPYYDTERGRAHVFMRTGTTWSHQANLLASDGINGDRFGWSVANYGNNVIVGAPLADVNGTNSGAAYVFSRTGNAWPPNWLLRKKLDFQIPIFPFTGYYINPNDYTAWSVATGYGHFLIGSVWHDNGSTTDNGSVFAYEDSFTWDGGGANNNWTTAANWVGDVTPTYTDTVRFDATSGKNAAFDITEIGNLIITDEYTGTITITTGGYVVGNYVQYGGNFNISYPTSLVVDNNFQHMGGMIQEGRNVPGNSIVNFLQIQSLNGNTYNRGVTLDTTSSGNNLGVTTVFIKVVDRDNGKYCTTTGASSPPYANRCFDIQPTNDLSATVTLWTLNSQFPQNFTDCCSAYRYDWSGWIQLTSVTTGTTGLYTWVKGNAANFSLARFLITQAGTGSNSPTAVTLQSATTEAASPLKITLVMASLLALSSLGLAQRRRKGAANFPDSESFHL